MNIGEANAVNTILRSCYFEIVDRDEVDKAARLLLAKAHKVLGAGLSVQQLDAELARWDGAAK